MQIYRNAPPDRPLVTTIGERIVALDPETGALRWEARMPQPVHRVAIVADTLFLTARGTEAVVASERRDRVFLLDLATGKQRGVVDAGIEIDAVLVRGERVYFSGCNGCVAISRDGHVMFRAITVCTKSSAWSGSEHDLVGYDAAGRETWRIPQLGTFTETWLALDDRVAQVDRSG